MKHILVTGGCGFVGSHLALSFKAAGEDVRVTAFDNLRRRGSELTLQRLREGGVEFHHGDIRNPEDLMEVGPFDLLLECSAEPSVHAGYGASPAYVIHTNLFGTVHCLEEARKHEADVVFLSTSRVYPIAGLRALPLKEGASRLTLPADAEGPGWSQHGIAETFPLEGSRSIYGATKLASELIVEEYREMYGLRTLINRCGVLTGPWQMGKVDQGFVVLWAARHLYGGPLGYMGFGGTGRQVRDILHVADLYDLLTLQLAGLEKHQGKIYNVGGGQRVSTSLVELTGRCEQITGNQVAMGSDPETRTADIPYYISDSRAVEATTGWVPKRGVEVILEDIVSWLAEHRKMLEPILG